MRIISRPIFPLWVCYYTRDIYGNGLLVHSFKEEAAHKCDHSRTRK